MTELVNIPDELQPQDPEVTNEPAPVVLEFEGFGEIVAGHGNATHATVVAMCLLDNPNVNKFFLASNLKLTDRITKTKIFPREGMSLPNGETYTEGA
jgi:hypothetical protein